MSKHQAARVRELFEAAVDLPAGERTRFLSGACGDDAALAAEVAALLRVDSHVGEQAFISPIRRTKLLSVDDLEAGGGERAGAAFEIPRRIGRYEIVRKIGDGGMGVVYEARQENPRRTVALKVIRPDYISRETLRRFQREAEVLGQLQHPGIAQVYEAGVAELDAGHESVTRASLPFFAMEFVRGDALSEYGGRPHVVLREKLELIAKVCDAVHHAHIKGIVHRDLKPANILVVTESRAGQDRGRDDASTGANTVDVARTSSPKILDFGVARLIDSDVQNLTLQTGVGQLIGTVPYMSPEQVLGDPLQVDTRSDVYSIGVILYEMLAGRPPHDVRNRPIPEAARMIRDDEPQKLSSVNAACRGDVDTIVSKALEKDRSRRYQSAAELGADIRRHLSDEPINARPPTAMYQFRKFAKRNRGLVAGAALATLTLVAGSIATGAFAVRATHDRAAALAAQQRAERTAYRAAIFAAGAALENHDVEQASRHLDATPPSLRGWEWRYMHSQLDQSVLKWTPALARIDDIAFAGDGGAVRIIGAPEVGRENPSAAANRLVQLPMDRNALANALSLGDADARRALDDRYVAEVAVDGSELEITDLERGGCDRIDLVAVGIQPDEFRVLEIKRNGRFLFLIDGRHAHVYVIDRELGVLHTWPFANDGSLITMDVSADGRIAIAADMNGRPVVWNPISQEVVHLAFDRGAISSIAFSPDGKRVLTGGKDSTVRLWDSETGEQVAAARDHRHAVPRVAFSNDGGIAISASVDRTIRVWNSQTLEPMAAFHGHTGDIWSAVVSPDGRLLATFAEDGTVRIWDLSRRSSPGELRGHGAYVYPVVFSPNGKLVASGSWDGTVRIWNAYTFEPVHVMQTDIGYVEEVSFSADGAFIACRTSVAILYVFEVATGRKVTSVPIEAEERHLIWLDGEQGIVTRFDAAARNVTVLDWRHERRVAAELSILARVHSERLSPDGRFVAFASAAPAGLPRRQVSVVSIASGEVVAEIRMMFGGHFDFAWIKDVNRTRFVAGAQDDSAAFDVYEVSPLRRVAHLVGHTDEVYGLTCSPDGTRIATGSRDQTIRLWDAQTFEELAQLRGHLSYVWSLSFSPDGTQLASSSGDGTVRIWDTVPLSQRRKAMNSP